MTDTRQPPRPDNRPQGSTPAGQGGNGGPEDDPLFELARIVADSIRSEREAEAGRAGQPEPGPRAVEPPPLSGGVFGFDADAFENELLRSAEEQVAPSRPLRSRATPLAPRSAESAPRIEPPMAPLVPPLAPAVAPPVAAAPPTFEEPPREEDEVFLDHDVPPIDRPRDVAPPRVAQDRFTQDFEAALFGAEPKPAPRAPEPVYEPEPLDEPDPNGEPAFEFEFDIETPNDRPAETGRGTAEPESDFADAQAAPTEEAEPFSPAAVEEAPSPQKRGAFTFDPDLEQALGGELRASLGSKTPEIKADRDRDTRSPEVRPPATDESTLILGARPMRGPAAKLNTLSQQEPVAVARQDQSQFEPIPPLEKAPLRPGASPVKPTVIDTPPVPPIDDPKPAASEERREPDFDFGSLDLDLDHGPDPAAIGATRPIEPPKRPAADDPAEAEEAAAAAAGSLSWLRSERDPAGDGLDGDLGEEAEDSFGRPPQGRGARRGQKRGIWILATVVVVAVAGIGAYQVLGLVGGNSAGGPPPEIKADSSPVKEAPPSTDQQNASNANDSDPSKVFYDRVANTNDPAKQNLNTAAAPGESAQGAGAAAGASKSDLPGVNVGDAPTSADSDGQAMVPRKVRTVVVRPDGTIVTPDPSQVAEAAAQNAGSAPSSDPFGGGGEASPLSPPSGQPAAAGADQGGNAAAADDDFYPAPPRKPVRAGQAAPAATQPAAQAAQPEAQAADAAPTPAPAEQATAPAEPAPAPAAPAAPSPAASSAPQSLADAAGGGAPAAQPAAAAASPGGYGIQVASQKTEADAQKVYAGLQRRFASVLAGRPAVIRQVDLGAKGVYYRVKVPAGSSAEATSLCNALKAAGGDCYVSKL